MVATLEEPKYELVSTHENFEIRLYEEVIQARVTRKIVERLTPVSYTHLTLPTILLV